MALSSVLNRQDAGFRQRRLPCQIVYNSPRFRQHGSLSHRSSFSWDLPQPEHRAAMAVLE